MTAVTTVSPTGEMPGPAGPDAERVECQPIVTSMTRTREDVEKLRRHNGNASEQSCHCHGTTFDISYLHYVPVQDPDGPAVRPTRNDTLKYVLSEVLNDLRRQGTCYVKYEAKQSCFHITAR